VEKVNTLLLMSLLNGVDLLKHRLVKLVIISLSNYPLFYCKFVKLTQFGSERPDKRFKHFLGFIVNQNINILIGFPEDFV